MVKFMGRRGLGSENGQVYRMAPKKVAMKDYKGATVKIAGLAMKGYKWATSKKGVFAMSQ